MLLRIFLHIIFIIYLYFYIFNEKEDNMSSNQLPLDFAIIEKNNMNTNIEWHETPEILLVLDGTLHVKVSIQNYVLHSYDVLIINPFTPHELLQMDGIVLSFLLDLSSYKNVLQADYTNTFSCNSSTDSKKEYYKPLIMLLLSLADIYTNNSANPYIPLLLSGKINQLSYELLTNYADFDSSTQTSDSHGLHHLQAILTDIKEHYSTNLTLTELAARHYLTQPYISNLFKKYLNESFTTYITELRLKKAYQLLLTSDYNIDTLSDMSGFANTRSFGKYFKESYGESPANFRKHNKQKHLSTFEESKLASTNSPVSRVKTILAQSNIPSAFSTTVGRKQKNEKVSLSPISFMDPVAPKVSMHHLFFVPDYQYLLYQTIQKMALNATEQIPGLSFILSNIIGTSSTCVFQIQNQSLTRIQFGAIDMVLDFLQQIKISPIFHIDAELVENDYIDSLLSVLLQHLSLHYAKSDLSFGFYIDGEITHAINVFSIIKRQLNSLILPFSIQLYLHTTLSDFVKSANIFPNNLIPDFLIIEFEHFGICQENVCLFETIKKSSSWSNASAIMCDVSLESNTPYEINDTIIRSGYLLNSILYFYNTFSGTACFLLTDFTLETGKNKLLFHGYNGIYCSQFFRKTSYYVFDTLKFFFSNPITVERNYMVSKVENDLFILLHNNLLYQKYASRTADLLTLSYSTDLLDNYPIQTFNLSVSDLNCKKIVVHTFLYSSQSGDIYQYWLQCGRQDISSEFEIMDLKRKGEPDIHKKIFFPENGKITLSYTLKACDFMMIKIEGSI